MKIQSKDYRDYVIKDGKFVGEFEQMYQNIEDPWHHGDATDIQYDMVLYLISRHKICSKGGDVLDIGCGKGAFTSRVGKQIKNAKITAIDISPTAIKNAMKKYHNSNISFKVMDITKEYKNIKNKYDLIIISQLMWYVLPNFKEIVNKMITLLNGGGYLIISQTFYKPEEQGYGGEIVSTLKDMLNLIKIKPIEIIELNRFSNHNAIIIFKNK